MSDISILAHSPRAIGDGIFKMDGQRKKTSRFYSATCARDAWHFMPNPIIRFGRRTTQCRHLNQT
jgi:hypothetical protein